MTRLFDKAILFIMTLLVFCMDKSTAMPVVALLCAAAVSLMGQCFEEVKFSYAIQIVYVLLCFADPYFCAAVSLVFYDIIHKKRYWLMAVTGASAIYQMGNFSYHMGFFVLASIFTAVILENHSSRLDLLEQKLIETRDNSQELTMLLTEKNRRLCESQDYEIYLATLKERNRIAREIHDNVGHMLTRTILQVGALLIINKDENQKEGLESIKETLNNAMTSIRQSVHDLHDESVDLRQTIDEAIRSVSEKFEVTKDFDFSDVMPRNVKFAIIGIVKEGLNNAAKHSNGDKIFLSVQEHPAFYQLTIEDNGSNSGEIHEGGIGLSNMRDRVKNLGGIIQINSLRNGFKIFVSIPKGRTAMIQNN